MLPDDRFRLGRTTIDGRNLQSIDPIIAMKIIGHSDCRTTANVYTHIRDDMLKKRTVSMADVFRKPTKHDD